MWRVRRRRGAPRIAAAVVLAMWWSVAACTGSGEPGAPGAPSELPAGSSAVRRDPQPSPAAPSPGRRLRPPEASQSGRRLPEVTSPWSLPALMRAEPDPGRIRRLGTAAVTDAYTRYRVAYGSGDLMVSGVLLVPHGRGRFPGVVLAHGYIDPSLYVTGQGLAREQDYLARRGFVVLHTDYRGHAGSDPGAVVSRETRLGYTRDTVNAVLALRREREVDPRRIALLGRSMGGGVVLNTLVARPGLVRAAVLYAPVSSRFTDNLRRWTIPQRPEAAGRLFARFGTPRQSPGFYRALSARSYFRRVTEPVLIHHGTSDDSCPVRWSRTTQRLLRRAGVDSTLLIYPGEEHAFVPEWERSMRATTAFLRRHLADRAA